MKQKIDILFVCLGNICRSPMAEFIMREKAKQAHLDNVILSASAGTSGWHDGEDMHKGTAKMLTAHHIAPTGFVSRKVRQSDWQQFDYIVAMDNSNLRELETIFGKHPQKLFNIATLCPNLAYDHIPDPWYTDNFAETYQLLDECCSALLARIQADFA